MDAAGEPRAGRIDEDVTFDNIGPAPLPSSAFVDDDGPSSAVVEGDPFSDLSFFPVFFPSDPDLSFFSFLPPPEECSVSCFFPSYAACCCCCCTCWWRCWFCAVCTVVCGLVKAGKSGTVTISGRPETAPGGHTTLNGCPLNVTMKAMPGTTPAGTTTCTFCADMLPESPFCNQPTHPKSKNSHAQSLHKSTSSGVVFLKLTLLRRRMFDG